MLTIEEKNEKRVVSKDHSRSKKNKTAEKGEGPPTMGV